MEASKRAGRETLVRFPATISGMATAADVIRAFLDGVEVSPARRYQLELTFDEIVSNIVRHGQPVSSVELVITLEDAEALMTFDDDGVAFDPRAFQNVPQRAPIERAQAGGFGLILVRKCASRIEYERTPQHHNRLTVAIPLR